MIVVDSSVWIARLRGHENPAVAKLDSVLDSEEILTGDIVLLEVLQGARDDRDAARIERYMRSYRIAPMLTVESSIRAAGNFRKLRAKGFTVRKTVDLIIATFCLDGDHRLLQDDRNFLPMVEHLGLRLA